jgi:hypothetical protein
MVDRARQTWGRRCDSHLILTNVTGSGRPPVNIAPGDGACGILWPDVQTIWLYVSEHHLDNFDYFLFSDNELFVVAENLRMYLSSDEISQATSGGNRPIYLGRRYQLPDGEVRQAVPDMSADGISDLISNHCNQ